MSWNQLPIQTERLALRSIELSDKPALVVLFADPEVMRFSDDGPLDEARAGAWVDQALRDFGERPWVVFVIIERPTGNVVGYCGLFAYDIDGQPEIEIGYRLVRKARGKGYATEAGRLVLDYAHLQLRLKRIVAMIDPGNEASRNVAEKLGMAYERDIMMPGYTHPDRLYVSEVGS